MIFNYFLFESGQISEKQTFKRISNLNYGKFNYRGFRKRLKNF